MIIKYFLIFSDQLSSPQFSGFKCSSSLDSYIITDPNAQEEEMETKSGHILCHGDEMANINKKFRLAYIVSGCFR